MSPPTVDPGGPWCCLRAEENDMTGNAVWSPLPVPEGVFVGIDRAAEAFTDTVRRKLSWSQLLGAWWLLDSDRRVVAVVEYVSVPVTVDHDPVARLLRQPWPNGSLATYYRRYRLFLGQGGSPSAEQTARKPGRKTDDDPLQANKILSAFTRQVRDSV